MFTLLKSKNKQNQVNAANNEISCMVNTPSFFNLRMSQETNGMLALTIIAFQLNNQQLSAAMSKK